jgi:RNA polymerase sigma factor (sigma-70 family)
VNDPEWLAEAFQAHRPHLRAVAYRMLGSLSEADDAVQESWLRLNRSGADGVQNLGGWLTTVLARVCLDLLRTRRARREDPIDGQAVEPIAAGSAGDPEDEAVLADSVGLALLVVLETLTPAERLAFVLHDLFAMPFEEIAPVVGRTPAAARQLASRARRRVQGTTTVQDPDLARQRRVVDAFLAASRGGDFDALLTLLDPDVVLRADPGAVPVGEPTLLHGATAVVEQARSFSGRAPHAQSALVNGSVGVVVAPHGRLFLVMTFGFSDGRIAEIEVIADPQRLDRLELSVL